MANHILTSSYYVTSSFVTTGGLLSNGSQTFYGTSLLGYIAPATYVIPGHELLYGSTPAKRRRRKPRAKKSPVIIVKAKRRISLDGV